MAHTGLRRVWKQAFPVVPPIESGDGCREWIRKSACGYARDNIGGSLTTESNDGRRAAALRASRMTFLRSTNLHPLSVALSNDGTRAAAIQGYRTASTWDMSTGNQVAACQSQRGDVNCCAMRGDGLLMATGSTDKTARLWDVQTGEPVSPPMRHSDQLVFVAFREAGNELVTVSRDAVIQLWTLDDGSPRERLSHLARATSGLVIDDNGSAVVLKPERIKAEWDAAVHAANSVSR